MEGPGRLGEDAAPAEFFLEDMGIAVLDSACSAELDKESVLLKLNSDRTKRSCRICDLDRAVSCDIRSRCPIGQDCTKPLVCSLRRQVSNSKRTASSEPERVIAMSNGFRHAEMAAFARSRILLNI